MKVAAHAIVLMGAALLFLVACGGCATVPAAVGDGSDARGVQLLQGAAVAEGFETLLHLQDVRVSYEGNWGADIVAAVQPVLVDKQFRGISQERYVIADQSIEQYHFGPAGVKRVLRARGNGQDKVHVFYNGIESSDPDVRDAAALVADGYRMFLFGPTFFLQRGATVRYLGNETVDGMDCDNLLAVLRPGIGNSAEDRVIISIDRSRHLIRRLRMTVEGMQSTRGAVADVFVRNQIDFGGVVLPTVFDEELKRPFDVNVHHWRVTEISLDNEPHQ